jgi:hypothetical protein
VALPEEVLASVNKVPITKADLEMRIADLKLLVANAGQVWQPLTQQQLEQLLDELIDGELLRQEVISQGIDKQVEVQRRWLAVQRQFFSQEWLNHAQRAANVDDAAIEQFYEQNRPGFREPEQLELRQITVATEEEAKNALAMLYAGSVSFSQLAERISEGPNKDNGGLIEKQIMRANELAALYPTAAEAEAAGVMSLAPALETVAFAITQREGISNYAKGPDGRFHIFQLVSREEGRERPLTEVWDNIKTFLTLQSLQQQVNEIKGRATVERFADRLAGIAQ